MTAGAMSAARSARWPIRKSPILRTPRRPGAEVRALSTVTRVLTNPAGTKVTGVEYYDAKREKQVQEASVVVLAAWSAQNPRLMMISATDKHPKGLANSSGLLGKYMMAHYASGTWALFDEDVQNHMGTVGAQYMSYDRYDKTSNKDAFGSTFIVRGTALKTSDSAASPMPAAGPVRARAHRLHEARRAGHHPHDALRRGNAECRKPHRACRRQGRVRHAARHEIIHSFDRGRCRAVERQLRGRADNRQGHRRQGSVVGARHMPTIHLMGGTIMGTAPATRSPTATARPTNLPNSMGCRARLFPTAGASNPTFTIFALSQRGAEHLVSNWDTIAG